MCTQQSTGRWTWGSTRARSRTLWWDPRAPRRPQVKPQARTHVMRAATDAASASGQDHSHLTVSKALPLICRRSRDTAPPGACEENPDTPRTAEIPVVCFTARPGRLPRPSARVWILYLTGHSFFVLLPILFGPAGRMRCDPALGQLHALSVAGTPSPTKSAMARPYAVPLWRTLNRAQYRPVHAGSVLLPR